MSAQWLHLSKVVKVGRLEVPAQHFLLLFAPSRHLATQPAPTRRSESAGNGGKRLRSGTERSYKAWARRPLHARLACMACVQKRWAALREVARPRMVAAAGVFAWCRCCGGRCSQPPGMLSSTYSACAHVAPHCYTHCPRKARTSSSTARQGRQAGRHLPVAWCGCVRTHRVRTCFVLLFLGWHPPL